jgi:hypothetical protein
MYSENKPPLFSVHDWPELMANRNIPDNDQQRLLHQVNGDTVSAVIYNQSRREYSFVLKILR